MRYYYRVFLWENGQKGTEYSNYMIAPYFYEGRANEEIPSGEIILDAMPIATKKAFPPKTKFRVERYKTIDFSDEPKIWDLVVDHDDVEEYTGEPNLCCHRLYMTAPSVIAQGMHVDNISLTYEIQDVNLNYKTYKEDDTLLNDLVEITNGGNSQPQKSPSNRNASLSYAERVMDGGVIGGSTTNNFINTYQYVWSNYESLKNLKLYVSSLQQTTVTFDIPKLTCQGCRTNGQFTDLFELNTIIRVYKTKTINNEPVGDKEIVLTHENGPTSASLIDNSLYYISNNKIYLRKIDQWDTVDGSEESFSDHFSNSGNPIAHLSSEYTETQISFTTDNLSEADIDSGVGYLYEIECVANPDTINELISQYNYSCSAWKELYFAGLITYTRYNVRYQTSSSIRIQPSSIKIDTTFYLTSPLIDTEGGPFLMKGVKYSCYQLWRKAMLTTDTYIIDNDQIGIDDIEFPIILDPIWENRMKILKVQETTLETKNLWEVFLQLGYYMHAIPFLKFADDGTDRFILSFRQLGDTHKKSDTSNKITIFNSRNLSEYFTQYDCYITNLFSPQNLVEEWLVIKTNDSSTLVSNNTSILKTTYGISEIVDFGISYNGSAPRDALSHIFEKSIYEILTSEYNISPGKGDSLYYELGNNLILGLTYSPPTSDGTVMPYALKRIVSRLFPTIEIGNLKYNDLTFRIRYRTQDSLRISQVRPDIQSFMKNSSFEKYPHHEQYFGQQDKIVDSERLSRNLYGKLVRVGNEVYQRQEFVVDDNEKEEGDLVEIGDEPFYVTVVENESYSDGIFQKVTYSKNFNQLSPIVTIPSEPRFYEVSERSKIRREKRLIDFLVISTETNLSNLPPRYLSKNTWQSMIKSLIFNKDEILLPNYAWTRFQADKKRNHRGSSNQYVPANQMFPSVELDRSDPNQVIPKSASDHADCIVPLLHFPLHDGIVFEWDMEDNFKAGDSIDTTISGKNDTVDDAYYALQSVRYCDILGRADLFTFRLFNKTNWDHSQAQSLPKACIEPTESDSQIYLPSPYFIGLDKDCREAMSFNLQVPLLHRRDTDGEFVTFSNLFGNKTSELYCCLMSTEVSMFDENATIIDGDIIADNVVYNITENYINNRIEISFNGLTADLTKVKSLIFYEIDADNNRVSYLAKNFKNGISGESIPTFYIYPVFNDN